MMKWQNWNWSRKQVLLECSFENMGLNGNMYTVLWLRFFLNLTEVFLTLAEGFLNLTEVFVNLTEGFLNLTEVSVKLTEGFLNLTEVFVNLTEVFLTLAEVFLNLTEIFLNLTKGFLILNEVFPCFSLSCKANTRVKLAKTGHGPHSSTLTVICVVRLLFVLLYVLFVRKCVLPPGDNPNAVNKYINIKINTIYCVCIKRIASEVTKWILWTCHWYQILQ